MASPQSITVLTTTLKQKRQLSSKKRARPSSPPDGQLPTGGLGGMGAFSSVSTRPAALDRLSHESVVHIFSYLDIGRSTVLTTVACVCRGWKAAAHTDSLWARAAHNLLPFTTPVDNEAVQTLLGSVGGYRELTIRYASAIALFPPEPGCLKNHRALRGGINLTPFQVIFEFRDRIADRALISKVGRKRFERLDEERLGLLGDAPEARDSFQPLTLESMQMPWDHFRDASDFFTTKYRFICRFFVVNNESGRISLLLDVPRNDGFKTQANHVYASRVTTLPHAAALSLSVRGCTGFRAKMSANQRNEQLCNISEHGLLGLEVEREYAAAIGDVLHTALEGW